MFLSWVFADRCLSRSRAGGRREGEESGRQAGRQAGRLTHTYAQCSRNTPNAPALPLTPTHLLRLQLQLQLQLQLAAPTTTPPCSTPRPRRATLRRRGTFATAPCGMRCRRWCCRSGRYRVPSRSHRILPPYPTTVSYRRGGPCWRVVPDPDPRRRPAPGSTHRTVSDRRTLPPYPNAVSYRRILQMRQSGLLQEVYDAYFPEVGCCIPAHPFYYYNSA